jgi:hypothetical protein
MQIQDLSKELDTEALSAVRGGDGEGNSAVNGIVQLANITSANVLLAGAGSTLTSSNNINATQNATLFNSQNIGDIFNLSGLFGAPRAKLPE